MKFLYLLLTRSTSLPSRLIGLFTSEPFTHISLAFDRELTVLYSFARKYPAIPLPAGLMEEHIDRGFYRKQGDIPCALLRIAVPEKIYFHAQTLVYNMLQRREDYTYSILGLLLCRMHISLDRPNRYFCSQFVGTVLAQSGALELPKPASLMHPFDFCSLRESGLELLYLGGLDGVRSA
ncbi:MAG: hypothetical protein J6C42_09025 [Clostridia bacterium]|nr:hypothetical protein [Oscillospiraceae bacterium]MBO5257624.1 hypothetical protein [Clostridia bacterium]MBQ7312879.1 hypothetical protein [Clostridia bacterium]